MKFSVLMSVYHRELPENLSCSLDSLVGQTWHPPEVVLVVDGPVGAKLEEVFNKFLSRLNLVLVRLPENVGLAKALNVGLDWCSHEWVARMDSDDICEKNRFEIQFSFLKQHPEIDVLGALVEEFDPKGGYTPMVRRVPKNHRDIRSFAVVRNPISHPVVVFRKRVVVEVGGYPEIYPEDYLLWLRLLERGCIFHNLQYTLVKMRVGTEFIGRRGLHMLRGELRIIRWLYNNSWINSLKLIQLIVGRSILRLMPSQLKILAYRIFR